MAPQPWVITKDGALWARIERAAAAADISVGRSEGVDRTGAWRSAPLIVVDAACLDAVAGGRPPDRSHVVVVTTHPMTTEQWERCVEIGARRVLGPDGIDDEMVRVLTDAAGGSAGGVGKVVAVLGACGGAGATVLATALAVGAHRAGRSVLLCDLDPFGAGVDVAVGLEDESGARWGDISVSRAAAGGRLPMDVLYHALPRLPGARGDAVVLTYGRNGQSTSGSDGRPGGGLGGDFGGGDDGGVAVAAAAVLDAVVRAGDVGVVDLPRTSSPAVRDVIGRADLTVLVVPADVRGCYAAARAADRLADTGATVGLVVRGPSPGGIGGGDIATTLHLPLLAAMRPQPALDRSLDAGRGARACARGPLRAAASAVLKAVGVP